MQPWHPYYLLYYYTIGYHVCQYPYIPKAYKTCHPATSNEALLRLWNFFLSIAVLSFLWCLFKIRQCQECSPSGTLLFSVVCCVSSKSGKASNVALLWLRKSFLVLPLFGHDTARYLNFDFTPFFYQIVQFFITEMNSTKPEESNNVLHDPQNCLKPCLLVAFSTKIVILNK